MPFTPEDLQAIQVTLAPVIGHEAWGVHAGYGARLTINFGEGTTENRRTRCGRPWSFTRGAWYIWTVSSVWRLEDANGVLAAYEDPRPIMDPAVARLAGRRLLSVDICPISADTVFSFDGGLVLRLFSVHMDPEGDHEHWMLFGPEHTLLVIGPSTRWANTRSDEAGGPVAKSEAAIKRFETLCDHAWPCEIDTFEIQRTRVDERDRLDLQMRLHPRNSDDQRQITLVFRGVQYLDFSQAGVETGIDHLSIEAVSDRGWDDINYDVHNPGQHILTFCCAWFDVSAART